MSMIYNVISVFAEDNCVSTALFGEVCDACNGGGINFVLMYAVEAMIIGIGILAIIGLMVFGIQYLTAGTNSGQTAKAKGRLINMIIGLVTYVVLIAFVQFLSPEGIKGLVVTTEDKCPERIETKTSVVEPPDPGSIIDLSDGGEGAGGGTTGNTGNNGGAGNSGSTSDTDGGSSGDKVTDDDRLEVHFVSVGGQYDDVIFIRSSAGAILIDGGTAGGKNHSRSKEIADYAKGIGLSKFDYMLGSHLDKNHVEAQAYMPGYIPVGVAYYPINPKDCSTEKRLCEAEAKEALSSAMDRGLRVAVPTPGQTKFSLGKLTVYFIGTRSSDYGNRRFGDNTNSTSMVNYMKYGNRTFLFTGDLQGIGGSTVFSHIKEDGAKFGIASLKVDMVKWPHHGNSNPGTSFWNETNPSYIAVPNNGESAFPKTGSLSDLNNSSAKNAPLLRLSSYDSFVFVTDGEKMDVVYNIKPEEWTKKGQFVDGKWKFL